jgi:hypothetical protein
MTHPFARARTRTSVGADRGVNGAGRWWPLVSAAVLVAGVGCTRPPGPARPPTVAGPVTGGKLGIPFTSMPDGMAAAAGYTEEEFFIGGTATAYRATALPSDGRWALQPAATAPYRTRVVVRRPADPGRFSGNVIVEWLNVTAGIDEDPDFGFAHPEILRSGDAWVGVSAQKAGVDGPKGLTVAPGAQMMPLKQWDPQRYGSLNHPGDRYSYDIFTQVGRALRAPSGADMLGGLHPAHLIGDGESQSAARMISYVDGVQPLAKVYDGFVIHSRGAGGVGFGAGSSLPATVAVRDDLDARVLQFETETDIGAFVGGRQPDSDRIRTWEAAGTSHVDQSTLDYGIASGKRAYPSLGADNQIIPCTNLNTGPQRYLVRRALADLKRWVAGGPPPAHGAPLQLNGTTIVRDEHGNARGGVRSPSVDVPIAAVTGQAARPPATGTGGTGGTSGTGLSGLICQVLGGVFGSTTPFDATTLQTLYPTHDDYVAKVSSATQRAVTDGFLTDADAPEIIDAARTAPIPLPPAGH